MPRSRALNCFKHMPEILEIADHTPLVTNSDRVFVTEDLIGDYIDVLIDKNIEDKILIRVNGVSSGEDYRHWSNQFRKTYPKDKIKFIVRSFPIEVGVIRFIGTKDPSFLKVWGVAHWDSFNKESRYVPWDMLQQLCKVCNLDMMPQLMAGRPEPRKYEELSRLKILGPEKRGVLLIPAERPIRYIRRPAMNTDESGKMVQESTQRNVVLGKSLAEEFSKLAIDPSTIIKHKLQNVREVYDFAVQENLGLYRTYVRRGVEEAGLTETESTEFVDGSLKKRAGNLIRSLGNVKVVK